MFENITSFFKKFNKKTTLKDPNSKETAKERLHLVLMQDRANMSVDFLELMKQEIIEVIKKYIQIDENAIDVRLTNKEKNDGGATAPALYANIPILNIKNETVEVAEIKKEKEGKQEVEVNKKNEEKIAKKINEKEEVTEKKETIEYKEIKKEQTKLDAKKQVTEDTKEEKLDQNLKKNKEDLKQNIKKEKVSAKSEK